ncbi:MAG TPA: hypothetical protein VGF67_01595 [Ktedonobacteraceae bacterium]|jgi:hypothetical protein
MQTTEKTNVPRRPGPWLRVLLLALLLVAGITALLFPFLLVYNNTMNADTTLQTARQLALASPGAQVTVALEVTAAPAGALVTGTLLQKESGSAYTRTGRQATIRWDRAQLVMGSRSDARQGAILQVSGRMGSDGIVQASQVVFLTGFVQIH